MSNPAPRLVAERLSDQLAARLAAQIEAGELAPGDRLPTEQQLASMHGVSRTVVREAVHQLKSRKLLVSRQGSGVYVAPPPLNRALRFDDGVLGSLASVVQVREVRRALDGEIAALAAERATRAQVAALRRSLRAMEAAPGDGVAEDLDFHRTLAEATGNPQFIRLLEFLEQYLHEAMRVTRAHEAERTDFTSQVEAEHRAIFEAVAARDPQAARRAAVRHMLRGDQRLSVALQPSRQAHA
ncbi:MAG TPA: FadR/GntR family transcriptional regulator [Rhizobacter sp.]|nr:FadR/GntR family transcriptional regulator [Rhizobacter sp.]